jgi:cobaltochelatase CobN
MSPCPSLTASSYRAIAAKCLSETDPLTGTKAISHQPISERLDKLVLLEHQLGEAERIPPEKRKIAIIFHNYPLGTTTSGAPPFSTPPFGDQPLLGRCKAQGYQLDIHPRGWEKADGCDIISAMTNDQRWLTDDELAKSRGKNLRLPYEEWLAQLPGVCEGNNGEALGLPPANCLPNKGICWCAAAC